MKLSIVDAELIIRTTALTKNAGVYPVTFDLHTMEDVTEQRKGDLFAQDSPFLQFHTEIISTGRVGPTTIAPTRIVANLFFAYFTKEPSYIKDAKLQEQIGNWFAEQTIDGVRFRTFTPYLKSKENGFTQYLGVIDFDFELYRGA